MVFDYGRTYIVASPSLDRGYQIASDLLESGRDVLCVSRMHPDLLRERWGERAPDCIWLSERPGDRNISPAHISKLVQRIVVFTEAGEHAAIILDGIEYLSLFNDFTQLQMFMEHMNDVVMERGALFLVLLDPRSFDQRSLARLRRFAEVVE